MHIVFSCLCRRHLRPPEVWAVALGRSLVQCCELRPCCVQPAPDHETSGPITRLLQYLQTIAMAIANYYGPAYIANSKILEYTFQFWASIKKSPFTKSFFQFSLANGPCSTSAPTSHMKTYNIFLSTMIIEAQNWKVYSNIFEFAI